jgi:hypothetical protein
VATSGEFLAAAVTATHALNSEGKPEPITPETRAALETAWTDMRNTRIALRRWIWISCWNHSEIESDALWSRYVGAEHGIAVRSTFGRLARCFGGPLPPREGRPTPDPGAPLPVHIGRVSYVDYDTAVWSAGNLLWPFVHKRLSFAHEAEVRAAVVRFPATPSGLDYSAESPPGLLLAANLTELIEAIFVSPVAPPWLYELVQKICRRYGLGAHVHQSALAAEPTF